MWVWRPYEVSNNVTVSLASSGDGWTLTTKDRNLSITQPYSSTVGSVAFLTDPGDIPISGTVTATMSGTVQLTAADIAAGFKTFDVKIYDKDDESDDLLSTVSATVPAKNGMVGMWTSFSKSITFSNAGNTVVVGATGTTGEDTAEIFFEIPGGATSGVVSVKAL